MNDQVSSKRSTVSFSTLTNYLFAIGSILLLTAGLFFSAMFHSYHMGNCSTGSTVTVLEPIPGSVQLIVKCPEALSHAAKTK